MSSITLIAAIGKKRELGYNNDLIWKIPEDLSFFRENTLGKSIAMGLNTFNSLPKLLPNRKHIVLTFNDVDLGSDVVVLHSIEELLQYIEKVDEEVMIIGGAMVYSQMINYADKLILTEIDRESEADVYFPEFSIDDWKRKVISNHKYEDIDYSHVIYVRRKDKEWIKES